MQETRGRLSVQHFRIIIVVLALAPFVSIPLLGTQFYFRHFDSVVLLWAKEFTQPFYNALSINPEVHRFDDYPGIAGAWRPFVYLYVKALWHLFGAVPGPYYFVGGLFFMGAVYFLFRIVEKRAGFLAAVLSSLALFAAFHGTMYNLFHLHSAVSFFYQLGMIYFFWSYLRQRRWYNLVGMFLFMGPAMSRQTTPVILMAILLTTLLEPTGKRAKFQLRKILPVLGILVAGFFIITLSSAIEHISIRTVAGRDISQILEFLSERFFYYGRILTSGITGTLMLLFFSCGVLQHAARFVKKKFQFDKVDWIWLPTALLLTLLLMRLQPYSIYWLVVCCLYLFIFDHELRMPIGWAGASLLSFFASTYYHDGYLLGAGFPFAMALGILMARLIGLLNIEWREVSKERLKRLAIPVAAVVLPLLVFMTIFANKVPIVAERTYIIKMAIETNGNFGHLMGYLQHELPEELSTNFLK